MNEAKIQYQQILKAHPDNVSALNDLAFLLADTGGDLDQALKLTQQALAKLPNQPAFTDTLGYIYLKKGQNASAMQAFSNLVRRYPHYPTFRYHLGLLLYEKGERTSAKKELQAAMADHPSIQDRIKIAELLAKIG
jgi:predicted Zn-dependent protease